MTYLQMLLIAIAVSLDTVAMMIVEGSMYSVISIRDLIKQSLIIGIWQTLSFLMSHRFTVWLIQGGYNLGFDKLSSLQYIVTFFIFFVLGLRMIRRGRKPEYINEEHKIKISFRQTFRIALASGFDALIIGVAFAFLGTEITFISISLLLVSILSVVTGKYIGYWFGYAEKSKAHLLSGIIFLLLSIMIILDFQ